MASAANCCHRLNGSCQGGEAIRAEGEVGMGQGLGSLLVPKEVVNGEVGTHVHTYNYDFWGYPSP